MKWEYTVVSLPEKDIPRQGWFFKTSPAALEQRLNQLGSEGWELSGTLTRAIHTSGELREAYLIFKRAY